MTKTSNEVAPSLRIPTSDKFWTGRHCKDGESECVVCNRPTKLTDKTKMVWVHLGGSHVVTTEEGNRLNATGQESADLGLQPVGSDCLKRHPELKAYITR